MLDGELRENAVVPFLIVLLMHAHNPKRNCTKIITILQES